MEKRLVILSLFMLIFFIAFVSAENVILDSSSSPSKEITFEGNQYTISLISASDISATIRVMNYKGDNETKEINEDDSKEMNGIRVAVASADETSLLLSASLIIFEIIPKVTPTEETGPLEIPEVEIPETEPEIEEIQKESVCNGCVLDDKCYPFGYRNSGEFCSDDFEFVGQVEAGEMCENNFECDSNVCVSGGCVSGSLIQKILNWFKGLFGKN